MFNIGIASTSILALITPLTVTTFGITGMIIVRVLQGIGGALAFPCSHAIFSRWAPINERSRMISISLSGIFFGSLTANSLSGVIAAYLGWPSIYYIFGLMGIIWCLFWGFFVGNSPEEDKFITNDEMKYIVENRGNSNSDFNIPWKRILSSKPVWACLIAHVCYNWGFFTLITDLPSYLKSEWLFNLKFFDENNF